VNKHELQYALGRQPNDPRQPRVRLRALPKTTVTAPPSANWLSGIKQWGMLANDSVGDCTAAGAAHVAMAVEHYGRGRDITLTDSDALTMYEAISGYRPGKPSTDVGATLQDALGYWRATGIAGNKIAAFAEIDAQNLDLVRACIAIFGAVYTGMNFPASAMDQFDAGKPWSVVKRSSIEGGHCVPIGAYDDESFACVTWGQVQPMTLDFYKRYFDEVWVPIDLDWLTATGASPAGLDTDALNADYQALTGEPGPFPQAAPPVTPPVTPPVGPPDQDVDLELATAVRLWLAAKKL
jgi:hypothetical protein